MVSSVLNHTQGFYFKAFNVLKNNRGLSVVILLLLTSSFAYFQPQKFADLWLTRNQQGQILFEMQQYEQAAVTFNSTRWQAYSFYGAEKFEQSATLYNQYSSVNEILARANAFAHDRRYIKARDIYQQIIDNDPTNESALTNLAIVQKIIDNVNRLSESQKAEESASSKELGDEPQTGDGAEKKEMRKQVIEQLSAEQLLLDPKLNDMWLRQVQKEPSRFLSQKFHMQLIKRQKSPAPISDESSGDENE